MCLHLPGRPDGKQGLQLSAGLQSRKRGSGLHTRPKLGGDRTPLSWEAMPGDATLTLHKNLLRTQSLQQFLSFQTMSGPLTCFCHVLFSDQVLSRFFLRTHSEGPIRALKVPMPQTPSFCSHLAASSSAHDLLSTCCRRIQGYRIPNDNRIIG